MDQFQKNFIEEATDLINDLEKALLALEKTPEDQDIIGEVFRVMHSLKGTGSMFGYDKISELTHNLENIYDLVRSGEAEVTGELLNVTLESVDHLKLLLNKEDESNEQVRINHETLTGKINQIVSEIGNEGIQNTGTKDKEARKAGNAENINTFYISFKPDREIFGNGTNPLYLIDELHTLGQCRAIPRVRNIPLLEDFEPLLCYVLWEVFIATTEDLNAIRDVFIFVEDECKLEIKKIADIDLLNNKKFIKRIDDLTREEEDINIFVLQEFISTLSKKTLKEKVASLEKDVFTGKEHAISSIRVDSEKLDDLMNLVSEMVIQQARLSLYAEQSDISELHSIAEEIQKLSHQLRDNAFSICLIPVQYLLIRFQRLVRDLSAGLNKDIVFMAEGTETELDKTIIENLTEPLMHIIRNSIDHGIEDVNERVKKGKSEQGKILLQAYYSGANVHIRITDDGAGIDTEKIFKHAVKKGLINKDSKLGKKEILDLVFTPGFSTAEKVTDVSGRGVGMDVVKRKIADIRGEVEIDTEIDVGTTVTIKLPLTLSIIDGLLVKINSTHFIIPLTVVDKIYEINHNDLTDSFNNVVVLDGKQVPFLYLRDEFNIMDECPDREQIVVVEYEDMRMGLTFDNVIGEYQAVLKPLGKFYVDQDFISGATILGDGTVALVMDSNKIITHFTNIMVEN